LSPDHQAYVLALIEWDRALDLAVACRASSSNSADEHSVGKMLYPALVAVAKAGNRLSLKERRSIEAALAAAGARAGESGRLHAA